jgi:hypothetical protein
LGLGKTYNTAPHHAWHSTENSEEHCGFGRPPPLFGLFQRPRDHSLSEKRVAQAANDEDIAGIRIFQYFSLDNPRLHANLYA